MFELVIGVVLVAAVGIFAWVKLKARNADKAAELQKSVEDTATPIVNKVDEVISKVTTKK